MLLNESTSQQNYGNWQAVSSRQTPFTCVWANVSSCTTLDWVRQHAELGLQLQRAKAKLRRPAHKAAGTNICSPGNLTPKSNVSYFSHALEWSYNWKEEASLESQICKVYLLFQKYSVVSKVEKH